MFIQDLIVRVLAVVTFSPELCIDGKSHPVCQCIGEIVPSKQLKHCSAMGKILKL